MIEHRGYSSGHPWYYRLGGRILRISEIEAEIERRDVSHHLDGQIGKIDRMAEPRRSEAIRVLRAQVQAGLLADAKRYREVAAGVRRRRLWQGPLKLTFLERLNCPIEGIALKHNHLCYGFGQLKALREIENRAGAQLDLFG